MYFRRSGRDVKVDELSVLLLERVRLIEIVDDIRAWGVDSSGLFSVKSVYKSFFPISRFLVFPLFQSIWKVPIPPNIQVFSWTTVLGKLPTCDSM